jgi:hypothetical protein
MNLFVVVITWNEIPANSTIGRPVLGACGTRFCPGDNILVSPNFRRPDEDTIVVILCNFMGVVAASVILVSVGPEQVTLRRQQSARQR